jgi:hypothetical protein
VLVANGDQRSVLAALRTSPIFRINSTLKKLQSAEVYYTDRPEQRDGYRFFHNLPERVPATGIRHILLKVSFPPTRIR